MSEMGGLDIGLPDEGAGGASEQASEQASQQFAAAQAALQQLAAEEKKSKKRDDGVAKAIIQFLTDRQRTHLATLIARLVALDCPSPFLLALLSLINEGCQRAVDEYLREQEVSAEASSSISTLMQESSALSTQANTDISHWVMRLEGVLSTDQIRIVQALLVDNRNIDGTVLQLTIFILQEYLGKENNKPSYDDLQPLAARMLQSLFLPAMHMMTERTQLREAVEGESDDA